MVSEEQDSLSCKIFVLPGHPDEMVASNTEQVVVIEVDAPATSVRVESVFYKRRRERCHPLGWLMRAADSSLDS